MNTIFCALFLLFAFYTKLPSAAAADLVLDLSSGPLTDAAEYYLVSALAGAGFGGGLEYAKLENESCPLSVVQNPDDNSLGSPVTISSPYRIRFISTNSPLSLSFHSGPSCAASSTWGVVESRDGWSVQMAESHHSLPGWFKIEPFYNDYKLVFCPRHRYRCSNLGIDIDHNGNRRFVVTGRHAFPLVFHKFESAKSAL